MVTINFYNSIKELVSLHVYYQNPLFIICITTMWKMTSQAKEAKASQTSFQVPLLL